MQTGPPALHLRQSSSGLDVRQESDTLNRVSAPCAERFITAALAVPTLKALEEQLWLRRDGFPEFLKRELSGPLDFLESVEPTRAGLQNRGAQFLRQQSRTIQEMTKLADEPFQDQVRVAMREMARRARQPWPEYMANSIYRAFDEMDEILGIDYAQDAALAPPVLGPHERLYEGGGRGVQTSYFTILKVLEQLQLGRSHVVDLGSGFGRLGLVIGLLYPQIEFTGYEYVAHRNVGASACARRAGIQARVRYVTQDLAQPRFRIPSADVYYLYDPFTSATYAHVFSQLIEIGRVRAITVAAKAAAADGFQIAVQGQQGWSSEAPQMCDSNTLALFRSGP